MGKLKLTKENKRKNTAKNGKLLSVIVAVIAIAVVLTCVISLVASSGIVMRTSNAMKSDNYKISGNMMKYYYMSTYSNFADTYGSYTAYLSIGQGTPVSEHDSIIFGGTAEKPNTYDTMLLGEFDGTWYDYFMNLTKESVKSLLAYCEKADEMGIEVTEAEMNTIEASIDSAILEFRTSQLLSGGSSEISEATCLSAMYGEGMKRSDIRKAMKLSTLASKCQNEVIENIEEGMTDDKITAEYDKNSIDYDLVDYVYYSFRVTYEDAAEAVLGEDYEDSDLEAKKSEVEAKYKEMIEEAKANAEELKATGELDKFKDYLYDYIANDRYDDLLEAKSLASDKLPTEDELKDIKEKLIAAVIAEVKAEEESAKEDVVETKNDDTTTYTIYEHEITSEFATAIKSVKTSLFSSVNAVNGTYTVEKGTYAEEDDFSTWAFSADRKEGDITVINDGDGAGEGEFKIEDESFTAEVFYLTKTRYKYVDNTKDVAYMMFEKEDDAKKAIEKLNALSTLTQEDFDKIAVECGTAYNTLYEDYLEGAMQTASFDEWLYDEKTVIGSYTSTPLTMSDGSYMVAYYVSDGDPAWKVSVKNTLSNEEFTAFEEALVETYTSGIVISDWVIAQIGKSF